MPFTNNKGLPYPSPNAFLDVQDTYNLAAAVDLQAKSYLTQIAAAMQPTSYILRTTANGPTGSGSGDYLAGTTTAEWDPTAGRQGALAWSQPPSEGLSYYLVGADLFFTVTAGTPAVGNNLLGKLNVTSTDPLAGTTSVTSYYRSSFETNNGGESIQVLAIVKIYRGAIQPVVNFTNSGGSATYAVATGSRAWGMRLGTVPS